MEENQCYCLWKLVKILMANIYNVYMLLPMLESSYVNIIEI